jgi:uncharacterized membrane protein
MTSTHTSTDTQDESTKIQVRHVSTDAPLFPVDMLERMHGFRPDLVDRVLELTRSEADFRRKETQRINTLAFAERFIGQVAALALGLFSVVGGLYLVSLGHDWAGAAIAATGIGGLAIAFLTGKRNSEEE